MQQKISGKPTTDKEKKPSGKQPDQSFAHAGAIAILFNAIGITWWAYASFCLLDQKNSSPPPLQFFITTILAQFVLTAIVFQILVSQKQWKAMRKQGSLMKKQLELADRPWLRVDVELEGPLTLVNDNWTFDVQLTAKNVGRSVAVNANITIETFIPKHSKKSPTVTGDDVWNEVIAKQNEICEKVDSQFMSFTIFPNRKYPRRKRTLSIRRDDFARQDVSSEKRRFYLIGRADYQFSGYEPHHQTRFVYEIFVNVLEVSGRVIPIEKVELMKATRAGGDRTY